MSAVCAFVSEMQPPFSVLTARHRCKILKAQQIKSGSTVVHEFLGEAIARGTVPLEKGVGVNVMVD